MTVLTLELIKAKLSHFYYFHLILFKLLNQVYYLGWNRSPAQVTTDNLLSPKTDFRESPVDNPDFILFTDSLYLQGPHGK